MQPHFVLTRLDLVDTPDDDVQPIARILGCDCDVLNGRVHGLLGNQLRLVKLG
jgi:hypothetical protein